MSTMGEGTEAESTACVWEMAHIQSGWGVGNMRLFRYFLVDLNSFKSWTNLFKIITCFAKQLLIFT